MQTLGIDIETYSSVDLKKSGVYAYCEAPDFSILLFAYAFDNGEIKIVDLARGEELPDDLLQALTDKSILKTAFSATFEITCIQKHLDTNFYDMELEADQWRCTKALVNQLGLPGNLGGAAEALNFDISKQKLATGKALIAYFSKPCKATKKNNGRTRNLPEHDLDKWQLFKEYCIQDVEVERTLRNKLVHFEEFIPKFEQDYEVLDHKIDSYGISVDQELISKAIECDSINTEILLKEASELTGLANPNSVAQLKKWIQDEEGIEVNSLNKDVIPELKDQVSDNTKRVIELRQKMGKTSITKYQKMQHGLCTDGRVRGLLQYYGANRTGRWAGRLVQVQNLPKNKLPDLDLARNLIKSGDFELVDLLFGDVASVLSQLIRTAFVPSLDHKFIVSDFNAIEARIIAWLANEKWRLDVFATHGKIYEASASQMFHVPLESIDKGSPLRQKGKVAELALGYQGAVGALLQMGAIEMGLTEAELPAIVAAWRKASTKIVDLWHDVEDAAIEAVSEKVTVSLQKGLKFIPRPGILFVKLPSGRHLSYVKPALKNGKLSYYGVNQETKRWEQIPTYGGKLVENITQAIARDCLAEAMARLDTNGYKIVMHVHDEVVLDVPVDDDVLEVVNEIMGEPLEWAPGLLLRAEGFETAYYKKD